jgi:hypothetical protein
MEAVREAARIAQEKMAEAAMVAKDLAAEAMSDDVTPAGKVRVATNNEPWGPTGTQMAEIADMSFGQDVREISGALKERLQANGANWRYCYKASQDGLEADHIDSARPSQIHYWAALAHTYSGASGMTRVCILGRRPW